MSRDPAFNVALCTFESYPELHIDFIIDDCGFIERSCGLAAGCRVRCRVCGAVIQSIQYRQGRFLQPVIGRFGVLYSERYYMQHIDCTPEEHLYPDTGDSDFDDGMDEASSDDHAD